MIVVSGSKQRREQYAQAVRRIVELEAENARLRQQRDAANAQLDFLLEHLKEEKAP